MGTLRFDQKVTLHEIITENEQLCSAFVEYLASIHAIEAFEFWIEVELYKRILDEDECTKTAKFIFTTYLSPLSPNEINLEGRIRRELLEKFSKNPNDPHLFNKAQDSVEMMLKYDCLRVFLEVNKGKVIRKSAHETSKKGKDKPPESHVLLLQRYNSLIKIEKKKVRRDSFKKSISGTIRRFTTDPPKSIALTVKSNSFSMETKTPMSDIVEEALQERRSDGEESPRITTMRRARGKKIRLDPAKKWAVAVSAEASTSKEKENEGGKETAEIEIVKEDKGKEREEKRPDTPISTEWKAYEKPPQPVSEAGSTEMLVGEARIEEKEKSKSEVKRSEEIEREREREKEKEKEKDKGCSSSEGTLTNKTDKSCESETKNNDKRRGSSSGIRFMCFGGTKKKP